MNIDISLDYKYIDKYMYDVFEVKFENWWSYDDEYKFPYIQDTTTQTKRMNRKLFENRQKQKFPLTTEKSKPNQKKNIYIYIVYGKTKNLNENESRNNMIDYETR